MLETLRAFHNTVIHQLADRRARRDHNGDWVWPPLEEAMEIAGLYPIEYHIQRRQATILACIVDRPNYVRCKEVSLASARANSRFHRWWTQPLQNAAAGKADVMVQPPSQIDLPTCHPFLDCSHGGHCSGVDIDVDDDDPTPPPSTPSSPARVSLELACSTTAHCALNDSLSSFATALQSKEDAGADAADVLDLCSDSSHSGAEVDTNPDAHVVLPNYQPPMPLSVHFKDVVDLVSQICITLPVLLSLPRPVLGQLEPNEDAEVPRELDPNSHLVGDFVVSRADCRWVTMASLHWLQPGI